MAAKNRPYWHVDAKWLSAIALAVSLAATLPAAALYRATDKASGQQIISYVVAGLMSPDGLDSGKGVTEIRERVRRTGSEAVSFGGVSVTITRHDVDTLSPRQLRLKVSGAFAARFYDLGPRGMATKLKADEAATKKAESDAAVLRPFTRDGHRWFATALLVLCGVDLILLGLVVVFSHRFGRLVSPGVVLILVGLPGPLFWALSHQPPASTAPPAGGPAAGLAGGAAGGAGSAADGPAGMVAVLTDAVAPLLAKHFATVYLIALGTGTALLVVALAGIVARRFRTPRDTLPA
ncbi:MAG: hypothetical protein AUI14_18950 [Actinobacteria bacterium 13_2_20CM_2_71_6]|nr:MAG: hypothetical protein AUI14_18950 [Actinobacteria bacterium 13_2_20CM_2_71_6]